MARKWVVVGEIQGNGTLVGKGGRRTRRNERRLKEWYKGRKGEEKGGGRTWQIRTMG